MILETNAFDAGEPFSRDMIGKLVKIDGDMTEGIYIVIEHPVYADQHLLVDVDNGEVVSPDTVEGGYIPLTSGQTVTLTNR